MQCTVCNTKHYSSCCILSECINVEPDLRDLQRYVMPYVESDWESLCVELNFDKTGEAMDNIRTKWGENSKASCREVLRRWLKGEGEVPHTWGKMIECLTAIGALEAVGAIRAHLMAGSFACKSLNESYVV